MAVPLVSAPSPGTARFAPDQPWSSSASLMGLCGLLLGGWSSVMAVMTDSAGGVQLRAVALLVLVNVVVYRTLREQNRLPDGSTGMVKGALVGIIAGCAIGIMVTFLGPSSTVPASLLVLAFAVLSWLIRSVRRASTVIDETTAEFAVPDRSEGERSSQ